MKDREQKILNKAILQFEQQTGFRLATDNYGEYATLTIPNNNNEWTFQVETKIVVNKGTVGLLKKQLNNQQLNPLLITAYVNPELMKTLEKLNINFIDMAGNAYMNLPPLFIKIGGNKLADAEKINKKIGRAFEPAGMQIIFALLCNPDLIKGTYREIAMAANVALGTTHIVLKDLEELGYVLGTNIIREKRLLKKEQLLNRWITQYPEKLKLKYYIGNFQTEDEEFINNIDLTRYNALWGCEPAAAQLTNYLHPEIFTVYIGNKRNEFIVRNRLRKNKGGSIELMRKFWNFPGEHINTVPPILVYADLLDTGDPRNIETAELIYEQYILRYIRED